MDTTKQRISLPHFGFSCFVLVDIFTFHSTIAFLQPNHLDSETTSVLTVVVVASRIGVFILMALAFFRRQNPFRMQGLVIVFCTISSLVGLVFIASNFLSDSLVDLVLGGVLFGAGQGLINLKWLSLLTTFDYRGSYLYLLANHALATILCAALLQIVDSQNLLIVIVFLIIFGNILLAFVSQKSVRKNSLYSQTKDIAPRLGKGILAVCIFSLASGLMAAVSENVSVGANPVVEQYTMLALSSIVLLIMLVPALAFKQPLNIESSYKIALPLSALGFLILPGAFDIIPAFVAGPLVTTGYMMTGIVLSCTVAEVARTARVFGVVLFAATNAIVLFFFLGGLVLGIFLVNHLVMVNVDIALVGSGSLYLFVLGASWLLSKNRSKISCLHRRRHNKNSALPEEMDFTCKHKSDLSRAPKPASLAQSAEEQNLSEVEKLILQQLIEGRTIPRIAKDLYLSTSSVKYHTQKIYRAFGVHSRGELVRVLLQFDRDGDE